MAMKCYSYIEVLQHVMHILRVNCVYIKSYLRKNLLTEAIWSRPAKLQMIEITKPSC